MPDASPSVRYYRPLIGRRSGDFDPTVRDRSALGAPLNQPTRIEAYSFRLCQQTAWSAGEVLAGGQP